MHRQPVSSTVIRVEQRKPDRRVLSIRVSGDGYHHIADRAARADVDLSHMVRRMLTYASTHMPEGWVPSRLAREANRRG